MTDILLSHTGYHFADIPKQTVNEKVTAAKWSFAVQMFYHPLMGAIRASIIMFLFRVKDKRRHIQCALRVVFWINMGYMISTTFVNVFQCTPVRYVYARAEMDQDGTTHGTCIDSLTFVMASCALSIFMDLMIIPIPTAMVWNLQMKRKTKIAVVAIMSMGWMSVALISLQNMKTSLTIPSATLVSVVRLIVYHERFSLSPTERTWDIGLVVSIVEPAVGIITACAPAMKRLLRDLVPRYFSEYNSSYLTRRTQSIKSDQPRESLSFHFGFDKDMETGTCRVQASDIEREEQEQQTYVMKRLSSIDSRDLVDQFPTVEHPVPARTRTRTRSDRTARSETIEALPRHFLNHCDR